jgi:hypothetical protein
VPGHYYPWVGGVEHNDISVSNLMYDKVNGDRGVLNDYDLAHIRGRPRPSGTERTGIIPFMALDLLTEEAWDGKVARLYRHDCESFAWVLLWICCRYDNGEEIPNPPLSRLMVHDHEQCFLEKHTILSKLVDIEATPSYKKFWKASQKLISVIVSQRMQREVAKLLEQPSTEQSIDDVVRSCLEILKSMVPAVNIPIILPHTIQR